MIVIFPDHAHSLTFLFMFICLISCDIPIFIVGLAFALEMFQDLALTNTGSAWNFNDVIDKNKILYCPASQEVQ